MTLASMPRIALAWAGTIMIASDPSDCSRACARYARRWRPRFLAMLSVTNSPTLAARVARVHRDTAFEHRKQDPEFAVLWSNACEHATDLLEARAFQRALEGDLEPVYYMGVPVDYVRKFDSRLQIEMLRGLRPDRFKTAGVNVNIGTKGDIWVLSEEQRHELMAINRAYLESAPLPLRAARRQRTRAVRRAERDAVRYSGEGGEA
jgi:hypothetical protein